MKITALAASALAVGAIGIISAPIASADPDVTNLGSQAKLVDGNIVQGWTVANLRPSSDTIPYPVQGALWEATANDQAIAGSVTPIVSNLNARARSGETYRVLFGVATPQGVNPATLAQGEQTTGKVYFDVTGDAPDSVVYNAGGADLAVWVQPAPTSPPPGSSRGWTPATSNPGTAAPAAATPAPGTPAAAAVAGVPATPAPAGSSGTPLPAGSTGTPIVEGSPTTPAPAAVPGSTGTPVVEGSPATPAPAAVPGSAGTPAVEGAPAVAPAATGSTGTPVTGGPAATPTTTVLPVPGA
ncbi:MPT63 family protein [Mycolicibacterium komossense]|uniref:DUF1942 domain-containing protein n=1 Tax=Mycolicibacterium komossense TaxID=1779 RepID=A0ABT3CJK8_9MYCO|nr:MPT63 family protein [Mycolicibacterium komossense]MCV7229627.1 DUF1942 domain-containing protein [Mycolicibacterium komossense]